MSCFVGEETIVQNAPLWLAMLRPILAEECRSAVKVPSHQQLLAWIPLTVPFLRPSFHLVLKRMLALISEIAYRFPAPASVKVSFALHLRQLLV
jgi:hypothetical protein